MVVMLFRMGCSLGTRLIGCTIRHATTERIKAVYFNSKILNVRVCAHVSIGFNEHFKWRNDMQL